MEKRYESVLSMYLLSENFQRMCFIKNKKTSRKPQKKVVHSVQGLGERNALDTGTKGVF